MKKELRMMIGCDCKNLECRSYVDGSISDDTEEWHLKHEYPLLKDALKVMTNEWIEDGNFCHQTIIDMRDALIELTKEKNNE
jgi:hypothetical protein